MKIHFVHVRNFSNSGDMASCPYQYFKDFFDNFDCDFTDISDIFPFDKDNFSKNDCVIIGGGGLDGYHEIWQQRINFLLENSKISIGWGFGTNSNQDRDKKRQPDNNAFTPIKYDAFTLLGTRDVKETHGKYVPCVSCMNDAFDLKLNKCFKTGVILHKDSIISSAEFPKKSFIVSNSMSQNKLIDFIIECQTIFTNSYHACYWAALANVPVYRMMIDFNDSRFINAEFDFNGGQNSGFLEKCRKLNLEFFEDVKKLLF